MMLNLKQISMSSREVLELKLKEENPAQYTEYLELRNKVLSNIPKNTLRGIIPYVIGSITAVVGIKLFTDFDLAWLAVPLLTSMVAVIILNTMLEVKTARCDADDFLHDSILNGSATPEEEATQVQPEVILSEQQP
jgi:hypothetical protein